MVRLLTVGIVLLILGLLFVAVPLFGLGATCTINNVPRPAEECFGILLPIGYGLLAVGAILVVVRFWRGR